jgi:hypothetical protein
MVLKAKFRGLRPLGRAETHVTASRDGFEGQIPRPSAGPKHMRLRPGMVLKAKFRGLRPLGRAETHVTASGFEGFRRKRALRPGMVLKAKNRGLRPLGRAETPVTASGRD